MSRNPRILLLAEASGGVTRHVIDLYQGLRSRGWRVAMVLSPVRLDRRHYEELCRLDQNDITYIPMRRAPHASDLRVAAKVAKMLESSADEIILHAHSTKAGMIGARLRSRALATVFTPHAYRGVDPTVSSSMKSFLKAVEHKFSRHYDRIFAVSQGEVEYAKSLGICEETLRCIPNGIDTSHIEFAEAYERRRQLRGRLRVGFVGRLVHQKNPLLFLRVIAEVVKRGRDATAIVVGDGPMKGKMLRLAEQLGINERIDWRGSVAAVELLPEMDIMVHTSIYEGLPYSLIEACADLLPVVATSNFGSEAVFRTTLPENIASSSSAEELASILLSIVENDAERLGQMATLEQIARAHSIEVMVTKIEREYCALASR
jgi:glycosyltransferase involved in cell wall biosynthesis